MSIESDFFGRYRPAFAKLTGAGFRRDETGYQYEEDFLDGQFRACLKVSAGGEISGRLIDLDTEEEYLPIRARHQSGGFVGSVREAYLDLLEGIRKKCFVPVDFLYDQANRVRALIEEEYGDTVEFPWEKYPGNGTFKSRINGKWYAIILTVAFGKLQHTDQAGGSSGAGAQADGPGAWAGGRLTEASHESETIVEVVNLKADPEEIPGLTEIPGVYQAWHMNKKHWISVILDDTLPDEAVMQLIRDSHRLVASKAKAAHVTADTWIIPSNPKVYDIDTEFAENGGSIDWHQHNNIKPGDEVYIYSAAPNSAILYRCEVEDSNLSYHGIFEESREYDRAMRLRLIEKYPKDRFPLSFMKAHGGSPVRSARRMPEELLEAMLREKGR